MEHSILDFIQQLRNPIFDVFFEMITTIGNRGEVWFVIIAILFFNKKTRQLSLYALLALLLTVGSVELILKPLIQRPRPFVGLDSLSLLIDKPSGFSFPSGHAASSFAVAMFLYINRIRFKKTILTIAVLISFSRVYLYVHYPSDVIAGALWASLIAYIVNKLMIFNKNKQSKFKEV